MGTKKFDFEAFRSTAQTFATFVGGSKEMTIMNELKTLEMCIRESNVNGFENAVKNMKSVISKIAAKKGGKELNSKLGELEKNVKQSKERGNHFSNIKFKGDMQVEGQQLGRVQGGDKHMLLKDQGNERSQSGAASRSTDQGNKKTLSAASAGSSVKDETHQSDEVTKRLLLIRDKLCKACKEFADGKPTTPTVSQKFTTYMKEVDCYADILIEQLEIKSRLKAVKAVHLNAQVTKIEQEAKQTIHKINVWLGKLQDQIDENKFDEKDFQETSDSKGQLDDKKTKQSIKDICIKLTNRKAELDDTKSKCKAADDQLDKEIKNTKKMEQGRNGKGEQQLEIPARIQECTEVVTSEKDSVLTEVKAIYKSLWDWISKQKERKALSGRKTTYMIGETNTVTVLQEVSKLQAELFLVSSEALKQKEEELYTAAKEKQNLLTRENENMKKIMNLEEQIYRMWSKLNTDSVPFDKFTALMKLEKLMIDKKRELDRLNVTQLELKDEIDCLREDVNRFDGAAQYPNVKTYTNKCDVLQTISLARNELRIKMEEVAKEMQKRGSELSEGQKLVQSCRQMLYESEQERGILNAKIERINELLTKLQVQIEVNSFDESIFKETSNSKDKLDDKNSRKVIEDICLKLKKRNEEENAGHEIKKLTNVSGAKLTDNNPHIADLSDPHRPTRIVEEYSELYDNHWTDAYDALEKSETKEGTVKLLYDILIGVHQECGKYYGRQTYTVKTVFMCPTSEFSVTENGELKGGLKLELTAVQSKSVSELRKQSANECTEDITKYLKRVCEKWFRGDALEKYTVRCIELCLLMQFQTPPLHIDTETQPGTEFDKNKYKEYTQSGKTVDYVVWPALYLCKGGLILSKGVAQGY